MSNGKRTQTAQNTMQAPSLSDLMGLARSVFSHTTGLSENVMMAQQSLHGDLQQTPLNRRSVDRLVDAENFMSRQGPGRSTQDWLAYAFTPLRRPIAHSVARQMAVDHFGIDSNHEYAQEARMHRAFMSDL